MGFNPTICPLRCVSSTLPVYQLNCLKKGEKSYLL